jgi:hypothetical protein
VVQAMVARPMPDGPLVRDGIEDHEYKPKWGSSLV